MVENYKGFGMGRVSAPPNLVIFKQRLLDFSMPMEQNVSTRALHEAAMSGQDAPIMNSMMPVYAAFVAAMLALGSAAFTIYSQHAAEVGRARQQTYAALMGKKHLRNQLFVSRFEAQIFSDYHERLWRMAGSLPESLDLEEAKRWMRKSEDLVLEIARTNQALFENIGTVRTSFPRSQELTNLTERLYHFHTPVVSALPDQHDRAGLDKWKVEATKQVQALVDSEFGAPLDDLLKYLDAHMES